MDQTQKIIILASSTSLGLAVLLFLGKSNFPQKNNHQHLINNSSKEKESHRQAKKNQSVLLIVFVIVVIITLLFVIYFFVLRHRSRNLYLQLTTTEIKLYFSSSKNEKLSQELYHRDIEQKNLSPEIQKIYQDLQTAENKKLLKDFGELIAELFDLLDDHLLKIFTANNKKYVFFDDKTEIINNSLNFNKKNVQIYKCQIVYSIDWIKKNEIQEKETSIDFFKRVIKEKEESFYELKNNQIHYFFKHYFAIYDSIVRPIMNDLISFFNDEKENAVYQKQHPENYQKLLTIFKKIKTFLDIGLK